MDPKRDLSARPIRQWRRARLWLFVGVIALAATFPSPAARAQGNSVCSRWCVTNFPPGPARGRCVSEAAHGAGPCFACGPRGNDTGLCGGICCPAGETCSAAASVCVPTPMECGIVSGDPSTGAAMCGGPCPLDFPFCEFVPGTAGGRCTCVDHQCGTVGVACGGNFCPGQAEICTTLADGGCGCTPCAPSSQPLKTGQTIPYGTGSDGDVQAGNARSYTDNGDGTITDNATGLVWEKKDQSGGIHDWGNLYTWCGASCGSTYVMDGTITTTFLAGLNAGTGFADHTDWRIPNLNELATLVNYENSNPAVDVAFNTNCAPGCTVLTCSCTMASALGIYWSSTTLTGYLLPLFAWDVEFDSGVAYRDEKNLITANVRAVRGGSVIAQTVCRHSQPLKTGQTTPYGTGSDGDLQAGNARSYTDNGDGTITDNKTGLMWEKKDQSGGIHDWNNLYKWCGASCGSTYVMDGTITTTFLAGLNAGTGFADHTDWRIPNLNELATLVNYGNSNPAVDVAFNTNCAPGCTVLTCSCTNSSPNLFYWSSTTDANQYAWFMDFDTGITNADPKDGHHIPPDVFIGFWVRAVRGGL